MDQTKIPRHIGIIMDGNGRWASLKGKERSFGHKQGSKNVEKIVSHAFSLGVENVSLFAFSSENWQRPKEEVDELMRLLSYYFKKFLTTFTKNKIRLRIMGDVSVLPNKLQKEIADLTAKTSEFTSHTLNIGINYGGRQEIVKAVKDVIKSGKEISLEEISKNLYTYDLGEPDLIIRTGGEYRISNFMLFQGAYSELYFTPVLWPDFDEKHLEEALDAYSLRKRRFGKI
jgi:undecaprenyl diphosphate synthase